MNLIGDLFGNLRTLWNDSPLTCLVVAVCLFALATTPLAFAWMSTQPFFQARRGRVKQRPSFAAAAVATILTMSIPAIVLAIMVKSQYYDRDRYEFDPNRVPSVLDQGRQFEARSLLESAYKADEAVRAEQERLAQERKALVDAVKKLDQAMLPLSEAALTVAPTSDALPAVVEALAGVRKSVGVDAQPRWLELVAILNDPARKLQMIQIAAAPIAASTAATTPTAPTLSLGPYESEVASIPRPQQALARLLPLDKVPSGWNVGDLGGKHIETFSAENLYEKINGRAESFTQYGVVGMAYANFHPSADPDSGEVQLYIYEFPNSLSAFGKYGSEKPGDAQTIAIGNEGYTAAGSAAFYTGKYFVQIVSTSEEPEFAQFAEAIARAVNARATGTPAPESGPTPQPVPDAAAADTLADPTELFKYLPDQPARQQPQYVAQDAFGYSFLANVFLADYKNADATWQAFLRPYESPAQAAAIFEKYRETASADGATIEEATFEGADKALVCANIGLFDVLLLKGNTIAGVNGSTAKQPAVEFARAFASSLPPKLPSLPPEQPQSGPSASEP